MTHTHSGERKSLERHTLVTLCIYLSLIFYVLSCLNYFYQAVYFNQTLFRSISSPIFIILFKILFTVAAVTGLIRLLRWKRWGFYLLCGMGLADTFLYFLLSYDDSLTCFNGLVSISTLVSVIILFAVLQIKTDGISYWNAMDLKAKRSNYRRHHHERRHHSL